MNSYGSGTKTAFVPLSSILYTLFVLAQLSRSSFFLKTISTYDDLMTILQLATIAYILIKRVINAGTFSMNSVEICISLFYGSLFFSTMFESRDFSSWISFAAQGIGAVMLGTELAKNGFKGGFRILRDLLCVFLILNLLSMFAGINAWRDDYFLGARIAFTPFILLAIFSSIMYDQVRQKKRLSDFTILIFILSFLNAILPWVTTSVIVLVIITPIFWYIYAGGRRLGSFINYWLFMLVYLVFFFVVVILSQTDFLKGILEFFGEDVTFNGRTVIWRTALFYIVQKPLMGYGASGTGSFFMFEYVNKRDIPAHNEILNILYQGGAVSLLFFAAAFVAIGLASRRCKNRVTYWICSISMFSFLLLTITEIQTQKAIIFLFLGMIYQIFRYYPENKIEKVVSPA